MFSRRSLLGAACALAVAARSATTVSDLRVEYMPSPVGLDNPNPRFSWQVNGNNPQTAYEVWVTSASGSFAWDSYVVPSNATSQVEYAGVPLNSDTVYNWVVGVQTSDGSWTNSSTAQFTTGLLSHGDWAGEWIGGHAVLRHAFQLPQAAGQSVAARVFVTGVGCYELYLNGARVDQQLLPGASGTPRVASTRLNPGFSTVYTSRVLYNGYDVSTMLNMGAANVIGLRLGMCKYGYLGEFCPGNATVCNTALVQMNVYVGSTPMPSVTIVTNASTWQGAQGSIISDHLYNGETVDGRVATAQAGWSTPSFVPGPEWQPSVAFPSPTASLSAHAMPGITDWEEDGVRKPVSITPVSGVAGSYVWDMGINTVGVCTLTLAGPTPSSVNVTLLHGEQLNADGTVWNQFHCPCPCCADGGNCANQTVSYITSGVAAGQSESYTPTFSYSGFKFVQVFNWPAGAPAPSLASLSCMSTSSGVETVGSVVFNSSVSGAATLNGIQMAVIRSQRANIHSIPTDCPQREKRGWMADAHVSADEASLNFGMAPIYENWLRTHVDTGAVGCGNLTANWTCPKWTSSQPGVAWMDEAGLLSGPLSAAAYASELSDDDVTPSLPNCYICCYGRTGFGCTPETPVDTTGAIADVIPFDKNGYGSFPGSICWTSASFVVAGVLLERYGAVQPLINLYDGLKDHLLFYNRNANAFNNVTGLMYWEEYGDWNALQDSNKLLLANAYYLNDAMTMAQVAIAMKNIDDGLAFLALGALVNDEMPAAYYNFSGKHWDTGSQAAQAVGLWFGIGGPITYNETDAIVQQLVNDIQGRGNHPTVGTIGSRWLLQALSTSGRGDVALALATQTKVPSWGAMIVGTAQQPALGTLWEAWEGPGGSPGSSGNHIMLGGGIGEWFYSSGLGLRFGYGLGPQPGATGKATQSDYNACAATVGLGRDLRRSHGLQAHHMCAVAQVVADARRKKAQSVPSGRVMDFHRLRAAVSALRKAQGWSEAKTKQPQTQAELFPSARLVLDHHIVTGLRSANGHVATPAGRLEAHWSSTPAGPAGAAGSDNRIPALSIALTVPQAVPASVYLPVELLTVGMTISATHVSSGAAWTVQVDTGLAITAVHDNGAVLAWHWACRGEADGRLTYTHEVDAATGVSRPVIVDTCSTGQAAAPAAHLVLHLPAHLHGRWNIQLQ